MERIDILNIHNHAAGTMIVKKKAVFFLLSDIGNGKHIVMNIQRNKFTGHQIFFGVKSIHFFPQEHFSDIAFGGKDVLV